MISLVVVRLILVGTDSRAGVVLLDLLVGFRYARLLGLELGQGLAWRVLGGCDGASFAGRAWFEGLLVVGDALE